MDGRAPRAKLGALLAVMLFGSFALQVFNGSLPLYLRDRGYSLELIGVMVGLASVPQLLAPLFAAPLVDRRSPRAAIAAGTSLALLGSVLLMVTSGVVGVAGARVLQGVAFTLILPATYALLPRLVARRNLGAITGAFGTVPSLALALGPPIGIALLQLSPALLFGGAAVSALVALLVTGALSAPRGEVPQRRFEIERRWLPLLVITFLTVVYWGVLTAFLPLQVPASAQGEVGWFFTADALAVLACRVPAGWLTDRYGPRWLMVAGAIVTALALVVLLLPPSGTVLIVSGVMTGGGAALLLPPIIVELSANSHDGNRGMAMALYTSAFAAAVSVGSLAGAPLVGAAGFRVAVVVSAVITLAAVPVAVVVPRMVREEG